MDKIPGFETFEKTVLSILSGIKKAKKEGKHIMLIIYLVFVLISFIAVLFALVGAVVGGLEAVGVLRENIYAPKIQMVYEKKSETKNESGKYITVFTIMFSVPMGQNTGKLLYNYPKGCDNDNLKILPTGVNFKNGTTYAESSYEISCITKEPIIDNYQLFTLKK